MHDLGADTGVNRSAIRMLVWACPHYYSYVRCSLLSPDRKPCLVEKMRFWR